MTHFTVKQAAERLHVSIATVYQLCAERKLAHHRIGVGRGTIRISEEDLTAFLESCKVDGQTLPAALKHIRCPSGASP